MYQINDKEVVTFRTSQFERQEINSFLQSFQEQKDVQFSSIRDAFLTIFKTYQEDMKTLLVIQEENEKLRRIPHTIESDNSKYIAEIESLKAKIQELSQMPIVGEPISDELQEKFAQIKTDIFENEDVTPEQMLDEMLQIINQPQPAVEIPIEKVVEVEKPLLENQVIVNLRPQENLLIGKIAEWRFQSRIDSSQLSKETVLKKLAFNLASLADWNEEFKTGISERSIKQMMRNNVERH